MTGPHDAPRGAQFTSLEEYWGSYHAPAGPEEAPEVERMHWTQYTGHGPDTEFLGRPATALEIGSATCVAAVALARATGAQVTCVDSSPAQVERARRWWAAEPGITVVQADVPEFLAETESRWECIYSDWGAAFFLDPALLLPLVRARLTPGGVFALSAVEPLEPCTGPQILYGNGYRGKRLAIVRWMLSAQQWTDELARAGFEDIDVRILPAPHEDHVGTLLGRAHAPAGHDSTREQA